MKKHLELLQSFKDELEVYFNKYAFDMSDSWGSVNKVYLINAYTLADNFTLFGLNCHDAISIIYRNKSFFEFSERYPNTSEYDCSGSLSGESCYIKKCGDMLIFMKSWSYDV